MDVSTEVSKEKESEPKKEESVLDTLKGTIPLILGIMTMAVVAALLMKFLGAAII